jgi:hypothetical protein
MQLKLNHQDTGRREPMKVRVPFLQTETGLGDAISAATSAVGVKPCGGCKERAEAINRRVVLSPWNT